MAKRDKPQGREGLKKASDLLPALLPGFDALVKEPRTTDEALDLVASEIIAPADIASGRFEGFDLTGPPPSPSSAATTEVTISKRSGKRLEAIEMVRSAREENRQRVGFSSRPFVLCGLPIKRPSETLVHVRRNGKFFLRVTGDPQFGLPFGQDRLIPLWVATLALKTNSREVRFTSAAQILDTFGLPKDGKTYRRLIEGFKRIFTSTIFFGTEDQLKACAVWDWSRFHYFDRLRLWYSREVQQETLADDEFVNLIVLSEGFWKELQEHPIPVDLDVVKELSDSPGAMDFYLWLCWRCWTAKGTENVPLFGSGGLVHQLGVRGYAEHRKFRQTIRRWIALTKANWPECRVAIAADGEHLTIGHARAINPRRAVKI